jgi:DNA polymerase III subunit beta
MDISVHVDELSACLTIVGRAAAKKTTLPILSCVLLEADDRGLRAGATNLEFCVQHTISAADDGPCGVAVKEHGAIAVPASILANLIRSLPNQEVRLTAPGDTHSLRVKCGRHSSKIIGMPPDDMPVFLPETLVPVASIYGMHLRQSIERTAFSASRGLGTPNLDGVYMELTETCAMAATDGYRLAASTSRANNMREEAGPASFIIPARNMAQISKVFGGEDLLGAVFVTADDSHIAFSAGNTVIVSQLLVGKYPDYKPLIPKEYSTTITLETDVFSRAIKTVSVIAVTGGRIQLTTGEGSLKIETEGHDTGSAVSEVPASVTGEGISVSMNANFLSDGVGAMASPKVAMMTNAPNKPVVFRPIGLDGEIAEDDYTYLVMPLQPRDGE